MIHYASRRDLNPNRRIFMKEMKSRYMLAYGRRKDISSEEQTYYAHSMNTMRVVNGD